MKIIVTEEQLMFNSVELKKSNYLLPQFLFNDLKIHRTSLGDNPCFPMEQKYPFDYEIIKNRYKEVVDAIQQIKELDSLDIKNVQNYCNKLIQECVNIEKPIRDLLNKICENAVKDILCIPEETVIFHCRLTDKVEPKKSPRTLPEEGDGNIYTFDDVDDMVFSNNSILKRRFLNSLIQGASYLLPKQYDNYMDEIYKIDEKLPNLYKKIGILNDFILFNKKDEINEKNLDLGAYVEVSLGRGDNKTKIESQGIIFPYLLTESIRGFFELFASHGLPKNNEKAMFIIRHSDFLMAEAWDLRFGVSLWEKIGGDIDNNIIIPYYFTELSEMPTEEFNKEIKEILVGTKHGKKFKEDLIGICQRQITFNDLPQDYSNDDMKSILSDSIDNNDFTIEELNDLNYD